MIGRMRPSEKDANPSIFKMQIFADNVVQARSRFWYYMKRLCRVKKAHGEVISVHEVFEKNPGIIKNFGIWVRYDSRSGTHNMYKEFRDTTLVGAVEQMYSDLGARHRARKSCIQIIKTAVIKSKDVKRWTTQQFITDKIKFPQPNTCLPRPSHKRYRTVFTAVRPSFSSF